MYVYLTVLDGLPVTMGHEEIPGCWSCKRISGESVDTGYCALQQVSVVNQFIKDTIGD